MWLLKKLFSKRYITATLLVVAAMTVMAWLGIWQLDRRQQRLAANADIIAKLSQPPASLNEAAQAASWPFPEGRAEIRNIKASASGQFDFSQQIVLVQQSYQGQPGAHLVAPLVLAGSNQAVLVDRGWIPEAEMSDLAQFDEEAGRVSVQGLLQPSQILFGQAAERAQAQSTPADLRDATRFQLAEAKREWYRVDIAAIQAQMPYELLPVYLLQAPGAAGNFTLPYRIEAEFDLSEGPHMSYALQWFAFAITAGVIYVRIVQTRGQKRQPEQDQENAALTLQEAYDGNHH